ncbi:uncharacterized protein YebE (UPF0316 family) [Balneicella halophila]|uniref:UPF0316 protein C7377_0141 n=1 Tax=Balneicella halophila TaxID=1537566 RepID=A0A7L4UQ22_BALHA|nr:DUF2179 domain-containing protein [Balneicella halophila]PVX51850.1 uncharacterized protein YebE (UPF0316 family) [Balneicella halophila]
MTAFLIDTDGFFFVYVLIPLLIFLSRIADVTIGTIRIVFVSKGYKFLAPLLGFFEVLIWLIAMSKIFENLDNWVYYVAYSGGFAAGNYVGLLIEERMALGHVGIQIITRLPGQELIDKLTTSGYGVTNVKAKGGKGDVNIIYCIIKRKAIAKVLEIVKEHNPKAFYTIGDIRFANLSYLPTEGVPKKRFGRFRKGK